MTICTAWYALEAIRVAVNEDDEPGVLLLVDDRLAAVLIRLDAEYNNEHRGFWYLEAGFGPCSGAAPAPFRNLRDGLSWVSGRLRKPASNQDEVFRQAANIWA